MKAECTSASAPRASCTRRSTCAAAAAGVCGAPLRHRLGAWRHAGGLPAARGAGPRASTRLALHVLGLRHDALGVLLEVRQQLVVVPEAPVGPRTLRELLQRAAAHRAPPPCAEGRGAQLAVAPEAHSAAVAGRAPRPLTLSLVPGVLPAADGAHPPRLAGPPARAGGRRPPPRRASPPAEGEVRGVVCGCGCRAPQPPRLSLSQLKRVVVHYNVFDATSGGAREFLSRATAPSVAATNRTCEVTAKQRTDAMAPCVQVTYLNGATAVINTRKLTVDQIVASIADKSAEMDTQALLKDAGLQGVQLHTTLS